MASTGTDRPDASSIDDAAVDALRQKLADSEARFEALAETIPDLMWSSPASGTPDYYNERWHAYTGMSTEAPDGDAWTRHVHPEDLPRVERRWARSLSTGEPHTIEHRLRDAQDGGWRWFLGRAVPYRDADGLIQRWFGFATDIDDMAQARERAARHGVELERAFAERTADLAAAEIRAVTEAAGRRSSETARRDVDALSAAYLDNTTDGVFVLAPGPDGLVVESVNRVVEKALGVRRDAIRGVPTGALIPPDEAAALDAHARDCLAARKPVRYEATAIRDGAERFFEVTLAPVAGADGRPTRVLGTARDLTERRAGEQQLRQAQKMEAIGQLTGGIAHDFNNLLQIVKGNLDLIASDLRGAATPEIERRLRDAMAGAERGAKLTRQLLAFSRRQPLAPKPTDIGALLVSMADLFATALGETIAVEISRDETPWSALVDPAQLENAVLNLAINARDAMPGGGRLAITVRNLAPDAGEGERVEIAVADGGCGMAPEVLEHAFDPFFSTKPVGRGTGLGLPQVQGFIAQSNGRIAIDSAPGRGTTVRLTLPRGEDAPAAGQESRASDALGRGERILLVEDDDAVRRAVAGLLVSLNYRVVAAGTTREAEAALGSAEKFDLLLSDVVMPGQPTPPELARAAQAADPGLKVLFMSGYAEDVVVHHGRVDADVHLIEKPYAKEDLSVKLRELLDETAPESPPKAAATPASGPRRVLLVEDEPLIAMGVSELLSSFGCAVVEARTAAAAQSALTADAGIDLVLTDLGLPDMDGAELADWCRVKRPGLPIVFSTGRDDFQAPPALAAGGPVGVVIKPFDGRTLRRTLDECARVG